VQRYNTKQTQGLYLVLYNTDVWAAAIWGPKWNKKCVRVCLSGSGLRAKLKVGVRGWGPLWKPPPESWESQGRVGKTSRRSSIKTLVTQMTRNKRAFSIRVTVSPPPHRHVPPTCAAAPKALAVLRALRLVHRPPERNRDPLLANWVFVIAQSVVALGENET